jgi:hypothetical protein
MATDVYDDKDNTDSCEAAAHREAEVGPSIHNDQTMRGENGRKLATTTPGTVTMPPLMTTSTALTMAMADDAAFNDDNNVDDDGATGAAVDDDDGGGYDNGDGARTATVMVTAQRCCA